MTGDLNMGNKNITNTNKIITKYLDLDGRINMFNNKIIGVANGTNAKHAVNKQQLEAVNNKINDLLKLDGSRAMTGNLDMGGKEIVNIKPFVEDDKIQPQQDNHAITFGYFHSQRGELKKINK